ncbi:MAG: VWA domain-containing protein [Acidilobaceae archaeon]
MRYLENNKLKKSVIEGVGVIGDIRRYRGSKILELAYKLANRKLPDIFTLELAVDIFYVFNLPLPSLDESIAKDIKDKGELEELTFRVQLVSSLISSSNLWRVKPYTVADSVTSIVASASLIERLSRMLSSRREGGSSDIDKSREEASRGDKGLEELVNKALDQVERDVKVAKDAKRLLTSIAAGKGSILAFDESIEEILRLARETDISKVLEKIEGIKIPAPKGKFEKFGRGWIDGVEIGSDLERLHYSQLSLPWIYFLALFADSQLLLYNKVIHQSRGPIYVLLDKSGSMVGSKIDWARAVTIALLKRAVSESRGFYARFFDSIAYPPVSLKPSSKVSDTIRLLSYLARVKAGGGTDIARAIVSACEDIVREGGKVSDIILISDGEDRISPDLLSRMLKRANAKLHTIMIQGHNVYLKQISTRYMTVKKLESKEMLKVIDFI